MKQETEEQRQTRLATWRRYYYRAKPHARKRQKERDELFDMLGNRCARCGFDDPRALQIDHIYGGGRKHRKRVSSHTYYRSIIDDPDVLFKYQVLCANCNLIKKIENQEDKIRHSAGAEYET